MTTDKLQAALRAAELRGVRAGLEAAAKIVEAHEKNYQSLTHCALACSLINRSIRAIDPASVPCGEV